MSSPSVTIRNEASPTLAYVGMGANQSSPIGSPLQTLSYAARQMSHLTNGEIRLSRFYSSTPDDCPPDSPVFLNAVAELNLRSGITPEYLLSELQSIEYECGRQRTAIKNDVRPLDLDILTFADLQLLSDNLELPHPRAHLRTFVLAPLAEINPSFRLPGQEYSVSELLDKLPVDPLLKPV